MRRLGVLRAPTWVGLESSRLRLVPPRGGFHFGHMPMMLQFPCLSSRPVQRVSKLRNPAEGGWNPQRLSTPSMNEIIRLQVIDSHTGGEPTRVVVGGLPDLGTGSISQRLARLRQDHDWVRQASVLEPRGSDVIVGAVLCEPVDPQSAAAVIFFNNAGYLGMCGHGTIGVMVTLAHLGRIQRGTHRLETPVGLVEASLLADGRVQVRNVPSYRLDADVSVHVPGVGVVTGDVAWGGNWFFLTSAGDRELTVKNSLELTDLTLRIKTALRAAGVTGADDAEIDHIELFGPPQDARNHSRNFVLCPGGAYDRSPCGTGTSAKMACLAADGRLAPGDVWRQESIVGSVFEGSVVLDGEQVIPTIVGSAFVTADATLLLDPRDPFRTGISR